MDIQYGVTQRRKAKAKSKDSSKSADRFDVVDTGRYYGPLPLYDEDEELNPDFLVLVINIISLLCINVTLLFA